MVVIMKMKIKSFYFLKTANFLLLLFFFTKRNKEMTTLKKCKAILGIYTNLHIPPRAFSLITTLPRE